MATRIAFALVFSLVLVLSIRSVLGEEASLEGQIGQVASEFKGELGSLSGSAGDVFNEAKDTVTSSPWADWFKTKLEDVGLVSAGSAPSSQPAAGPGPSPAPAPAAD